MARAVRLGAALPLLLGLAAGTARGEDTPSTSPRARFERLWSRDDVEHDPSALGLCDRDGWVYVSGGHDERGRHRIAKVKASDGSVAWAVTGESYQPSFPVSDGRVVV